MSVAEVVNISIANCLRANYLISAIIITSPIFCHDARPLRQRLSVITSEQVFSVKDTGLIYSLFINLAGE